MSELKGYRCSNCGQMLPISSGRIFKCEYCGSEYEKENEDLKPLLVETCEAKLITFESKVRLNDHILADERCKEDYIKATLSTVAHQLAEQIVPYMEVKSYKDIRSMTTVIGGKIRIAEPNSRLYDYLNK